MTQGLIRIRGARQHNLKNIDLDIRTGELTVVTGPSGSGKSSLVFDTLFAEGQRRYVETFSAYARQFLDRMDKPAVDRVEGVPPAIAIDQTNPVRSSRSTVGTMTELNDHLKLLFARAGHLFDRDTAQPVRHDTAETIYAELLSRVGADDVRLAITFPVELPGSATPEEIEQWLSVSGFTKVQAQREVSTITGPRQVLDVVADRFKLANTERGRVLEAIEVALKHGGGRLSVYVSNRPLAGVSIALDAIKDGNPDVPEVWKFSTGLHCPQSDIRYADPIASAFSFNSAVGACETCRGFGRVIGVDYGLVIPNDKLTLRAGAIKPMQTPAWKEAQDDLMRHAEAAGVPRDTPWNKLSPEHQRWVINGSPNWNGKWSQHWFGIKRFFEYLETKSYKMHIRVLLSKYRSYTPCGDCGGARLKTESLQWRVGTQAQADAVLAPTKRFMPVGVTWTRDQLEALPGLCLHDLMMLPLDRLRQFFTSVHERNGGQISIQDNAISGDKQHRTKLGSDPHSALAGEKTNLQAGEQQALKLLLDEITTRLRYLSDVGIGYLTLDRQSRTLSGGEVQRINLTTALGTSLVNTLFVLDEPSIGLHPRDMHRIIVAMQRLRDAGNTLVVVEHDPAVMLAADRMIDMGPGPGERGGRIVFDGSTDDLRHADTLTGAYLGGRRKVGVGFRRLVEASTPRLTLEGARDHNLKNITVEFPLQRLVCITGVSGSGKSTLIQDILAPALLRHFGKATETPGEHDRLLGAEQLSDVVFVDQSPIGKTARSNPASYVGAWDAIREIFANAALSRQRSYTASKFSFNSGDGRCATCGGSGFEHVEMQFLSDVYLRCPDCDGKRYRPEILEVTIERGVSPGVDVDAYVALTRSVRGVSDSADVLRPGLRPGLPLDSAASDTPRTPLDSFGRLEQSESDSNLGQQPGRDQWGLDSNLPKQAGPGEPTREMGSDPNSGQQPGRSEPPRTKLGSDPISLVSVRRSMNVADVLNLTVSEAAELFKHDRDVIRALQPIMDVGLDYVKLGQPVPTLSGGEAQRLKLAGFLAEAAKSSTASRQATAKRGTLFMFDEPTTGLHFDDIAKLMRAMRKLQDAGHSLIVIEHNLDVIRAADWLIDLGPEGGDAGGDVVAYGTPEDVMQHATSHTGLALREYAAAMGGVHAVGEASAKYLVHRAADANSPGASDCKQKSLPGEPASTAGLSEVRNGGQIPIQDSPISGDQQHRTKLGSDPHSAPAGENSPASDCIQIINAREHNLKSLSVNIPRGQFTVVTGVSGSGKSTLAFDILFNEGQRRYLESLNAYARSIVQPAGRPEVDAVYGIPPTVAIEQRLSRGGRKSTVGTTTEVWHFLRLLYVKLGTQHCIHDGTPVAPQTPESIAAQLLKTYRGQHIGLLAPLVMNRKGVYTELADWARPRGYTHLRVDGNFLPTTNFPRIDRFKEHTIELPVMSLDVSPENEAALRQALADALVHGKGVVHVLSNLTGLRELMQAGTPTAGLGTLSVFSTKRACPVCSTSYPELDPRLFSYNSKHGWCPDCVGTGVKLTREQRQVFDDSVRDDETKGREQTFAEADVEDLVDTVCPTCQGTRLNATARAVKFGLQLASDATRGQHAKAAIDGIGITELARLSVTDIRLWVQTLQQHGRMSQRETDIARDLVPEIKGRLEFLEQVGLGYLTLDRGAPTLSGGEAQRIRLAAQLGSNLQGVCYVLDEPTIGLHPRDNQILLGALQSLSDKGNTLVVVEHDVDTIRHADHIIDIGPSAGKRGGRLVAQGSVADVQNAAESQTGRYLLHAMKHPLAPRRGMLSFEASLANDAAASALSAEGAGSPGALTTRFAIAKSAPGEPTPSADNGAQPAKKVSAKAAKAAALAAQLSASAAANTELAERTRVAAEYAELASRSIARMSVKVDLPAAGDAGVLFAGARIGSGAGAGDDVAAEMGSDPNSGRGAVGDEKHKSKLGSDPSFDAGSSAKASPTTAVPLATAPINWLTVHGAKLHNLQNVTAHVPLSRLVAVTGVSGSGKSTLARDVLLANVQTAVQKRSTKAGRDAIATGETIPWVGCDGVEGFETIDRVLEVDQTPIGKTPRSCPATYIGFWDIIRKLFADTLEAKARGYAANRFSFNTGEGRCPGCEGQGIRTIAMSFLPDVKVLCETCKGARFNPETLAVTWRGKNIGDVLQMEVDEATSFFAAMPNIAHPVQLLKDVGLGYLTLGQPSPTLSGGEAQRIKLVTELSKVRDDITRRGQKAPHTLYVLDEPTVGLHMADVEKLIHVLHRLVNGGHSVVVIEHDLDVIAEADWVIDLGPDGGNAGGRVVAATTPEGVVKLGTHTGVALRAVLAR